MTQMDLFDNFQDSELRQRIDKVATSNNKWRKTLFGRHNAIEKYLADLQTKQEELEREIYRLKQKLYAHEEPQLREVK